MLGAGALCSELTPSPKLLHQVHHAAVMLQHMLPSNFCRSAVSFPRQLQHRHCYAGVLVNIEIVMLTMHTRSNVAVHHVGVYNCTLFSEMLACCQVQYTFAATCFLRYSRRECWHSCWRTWFWHEIQG
jgi:hypothetical protein